jgi:hypothetical protein
MLVKWLGCQIVTRDSHVDGVCSWFIHSCPLTLILLTWRIGWAPNNASKWQVEFNLAFKGLIAWRAFLALHVLLTCLSLKTVWHCFRMLISKNISLISVYSTHVSVDVSQNVKFVPCSACFPTVNSLVTTLCSVKLYFLIGQCSFGVFHIHCIFYIL